MFIGESHNYSGYLVFLALTFSFEDKISSGGIFNTIKCLFWGRFSIPPTEQSGGQFISFSLEILISTAIPFNA